MASAPTVGGFVVGGAGGLPITTWGLAAEDDSCGAVRPVTVFVSKGGQEPPRTDV